MVLTAPLLREAVAEELANMIISGELAPGERLHEIRLCERLGVSRSPLRDAFRKLEADGLVTTIPRRGTVVATVERSEVVDLFACRTMLQCELVRVAGPVLDDAALRELEQIVAEMDDALGRDNRLRYLQLIGGFREVLERASPNRVLAELVASLARRSVRLSTVSVRDVTHVSRSLEQHRLMAAALVDDDVAQSEAIMRDMMLESMHTVLNEVASTEGHAPTR